MSAARPRTSAGLALAVETRRAVTAPMRLWRRSMRVRTVAITLLLSSLALLAVGTIVSYSVARTLYEDRLTQVLAESSRATAAAQEVANSVVTQNQPTLSNARLEAISRVLSVARPDVVSWNRSPTRGGSDELGPVSTSESINVSALVSAEMQAALNEDDAEQTYQSVAIPAVGGAHPGIVVGDALEFGGGRSELYLVYDLQDVQDTLTAVQRTLLLGGAALLLLIAAVAAIVASLVVAPIKQAAAMSEQLAAGRLEQRIPERGEDVVATLARSFNRMAESLQRQIAQLGNLSRVQQRFVSDVSHELRTPLTTIRLASDVLYDARGRYDAPTARSAELLRAQVQRFEALLADLLEISRMDAQAADVTGEPTNLVDLAREAIDSLGGLAEDTGTTLELVAPGGHVLVDVDARRIARIVRNLLANAIEHGEGRPILVTVDSSQAAVGLGVRDHGIGLDPADAERVFDRFWRADPSRQRRTGGTGLGLAISTEDALLHGGSLEVWSRRGDGTNFVLTLPRDPRAATADRPVPLRPADALPDRARAARIGRAPAGVGS